VEGAVPPLAAIVTVGTAHGRALAAGLVNDALSSVPFWTVTVRLALAMAPVLSAR